MSDVLNQEQVEFICNGNGAPYETLQQLLVTFNALRERVTELETDVRSRTEDWQLSEKLLHESTRQLAQAKCGIYKDRYAYQWHDAYTTILTAWHEEVDSLKQQLADVTNQLEGAKNRFERDQQRNV